MPTVITLNGVPNYTKYEGTSLKALVTPLIIEALKVRSDVIQALE